MKQRTVQEIIESREAKVRELQLSTLHIPADTVEGRRELAQIAKRANALMDNIDFLKAEML